MAKIVSESLHEQLNRRRADGEARRAADQAACYGILKRSGRPKPGDADALAELLTRLGVSDTQLEYYLAIRAEADGLAGAAAGESAAKVAAELARGEVEKAEQTVAAAQAVLCQAHARHNEAADALDHAIRARLRVADLRAARPELFD